MLCILIVAGVLIWVNFFKDKNGSNVGGEQDVSVVVTNPDVPDEPIFTEVEEGKKVVQFEGDDPNEADELTGVVTFAGVNPNNEKLMIRVNIDQFLENGKCTGYIYDAVGNNEKQALYISEVGIEGAASTSTCQGFDIPLEGLGTGKKQIIIRLEAVGKTGKIVGETEI